MTRDDVRDRDAFMLLGPLAAEPQGPPRIDPQRAMADGRRRLRRNRWAGAAAAGALVAVVAAGAPALLTPAHQDLRQVVPGVPLSATPPPPGQPMRVPQTIGLRQGDAEAMLRSQQLRPQVVLLVDAARQPGIVITQYPGQSSLVSRGSVVTIEVSK